MQEEMDVGVDKAGKQRRIAQVDDLRALRMVDRCTDGANAIAFDEDLAGLKERAAIHLEQSCGVENNWSCAGARRLLRRQERNYRQCNGAGNERRKPEDKTKAQTRNRHG